MFRKVLVMLMARFHRAVRVSTVQYNTVRFGTEHPDPACISTANTTLYLIGVVKVAIDKKARQ